MTILRGLRDASGARLRVEGSTAPAVPTVTGITLTPSTGTANSASGTVIGTFSAQLAAGSPALVNPVWTLLTSAGGDFQLSSGNQATFLPSNVPAGSYTVNVQIAASNLPTSYSAPVTITINPASVTAFYVAPGGSDAAAGTLAAPFATVAAARAAMAASSTAKTTYLRAGTYALTSTQSLTSADNNTSYLAYPSEAPVLSTSTLANMINANGVTGLLLQGLTFSGAVHGTNTASVVINGGTSNQVIACHFANNDVGLLLAGSTYGTISGNQFDTHAVCAIELKDGADHNTIDSNKITGVANTNSTNGAIYAHGVNYNTISHNEVSNCQGAGISVSNFDGPAQPIYTINTYNDVLNNVVRNTCTASSDSGAIYTVGRAEVDTKMRIMGNLVDGVSSSVSNPHTLGIYLDDEASGVLVQNNIVRGVVGANVAQFHAGKNCTMINNIFDMSAGSLGILFQDATYAGSTQTNAAGTIGPNTVQRNIFWSSTGSLTPYVDLSGGTRAITGNLYPTGTTLSAPNTDSAPSYGDPAFAAPSTSNYALGSGSAASAIGFVAIDQTQYGLHPQTAHWYPSPPSGYAPLTALTWSQPEPWGSSVSSNGENYKAIVGLLTPTGGTPPYVYSIDNSIFVGWNVTGTTDGSRYKNYVPHGWVDGPGNYPDNTTQIVCRVTDALGAAATTTVTTFDRSFNSAGISVAAVRSWPNNIVPNIPYAICDAQGTIQNGLAVTLTDPSGLWQAQYGTLAPISGSPPPVGSYPMTLNVAGYPAKSITVTVTQAVMGGIALLNRASVVSTSVPAGWPVLTVAGGTPFNTPTAGMNDPSGAFTIDPGTGNVVVGDPTKLVVGDMSVTFTQSEGGLSTSLVTTIHVVQGTTLPSSNMSFAAVRQTMTNDEFNVSLGAPTVSGISNPQWFINGYTNFSPWADAQHALFVSGHSSDDGAPAQFVINPTTANIQMQGMVDAGLDGTSSFTYQINVAATDGTITCPAVLSVVVSWAPVSRTIYVGQGMAAAHGSDGFEHLGDFRVANNTDAAGAHTGTWHMLISANAAADYFADDTGYGGQARFAFPGPIIVEGVNLSGAQPRLGGYVVNNYANGGDSRGKGFMVIGQGQGVVKNLEGAYVHGGDDSRGGLEFVRKDGATWGSLSVIQCNIHECDQGIETGNWIQGGLYLYQTELAGCGTSHVSSGACHNVYCGQMSFFTMTQCVSRDATCGHAVKSRAMVSTIYNNRLYDGLAGNTSSLINIPDGGMANVYGNVMSKGAMAQVDDAIRYFEDGANHVWLNNTLNFHDNTVDVFTLPGNHWGTPAVVGHIFGTNRLGVKSQVLMTNNSIWIAPGDLHWAEYDQGGNQLPGNSSGQTTESGTTVRTAPMNLDTTSRPFLSGTLPILGPLYRITLWTSDNYNNFNDAGQYADREQIRISAGSAAPGMVLGVFGASNDLVEQGHGTANPWGAGTAVALVNDDVYYSQPGGPPWRNDLFTASVDGSGKGTLKLGPTVPTAGVYWAQMRFTAPNSRLSDWRYPVIVTA